LPASRGTERKMVIKKITFLALIKVLHPYVADENKDRNDDQQNEMYRIDNERVTSNNDQ
jgi:hypothetical protein